MMGLNLDMQSVSYLTANRPEAAREVGVVIFPKTTAEALRNEISKRHLKFHNYTGMLH